MECYDGQLPHLVSCESCTPKSKGKVQREPMRSDGHANPSGPAEATARISHTLRQDRVQGEESKRRPDEIRVT